MEDQLISFKTAKLAQQKGFNVKTKKAYVYRCLEHQAESYESSLTESPLLCDIPAPTQSLLQRWIRETHKYFCEIHSFVTDEGGVIFDSVILWKECTEEDMKDNNDIIFNSYEEALEDSLFHALKLIK